MSCVLRGAIHSCSIFCGSGGIGVNVETLATLFRYNEDQDGQRILFASSTDGRVWSPPYEVFPSMPAFRFGCTTASAGVPPVCFDKIHHNGLPFVSLNGRMYAVSNLRRHDGPAAVYPVPPSDLNTTLLRRVLAVSSWAFCCTETFAHAFNSAFALPAAHTSALSHPFPTQPAVLTPGGCGGNTPTSACPANNTRWVPPAFGPMLWATDEVPTGYSNISSAFGIRALDAELTAEEVADRAVFRDPMHQRNITPNACRNGECGPTIGEQTVYSINGTALDVILYRGAGGAVPSGWPGDQGCANTSTCVLLSSWRNTSESGSGWSALAHTNIPDLGSNLNAGSLADGRVFLVWNGVPRPHVNDSAACGGRVTVRRNPLTLAMSSDGGHTFDRAFALYNSTVPKRYCGSAKPFGPSYPQGWAVESEGSALDGLWVAYSDNKEDIGVTFIPIASL